jgi:hypothetical protein
VSITSKTHSTLLQRFAQVGQTAVEKASGVDNTLLSKFCSGERGLRIDQLEPIFTALGSRFRIPTCAGSSVSAHIECGCVCWPQIADMKKPESSVR